MVAVGLLITLAHRVPVETVEVETQGHFQMEMVPMDRQIQAVAVEVVLLLEAHPVVQAAQAAPALLSSSTPYQAKPYLHSKALLLGNAQQV